MKLGLLKCDPVGEAEVAPILAAQNAEIVAITDHHNKSHTVDLHLVISLTMVIAQEEGMTQIDIVQLRGMLMNTVDIAETRTIVVSKSAIGQDRGHQRKEEVGIGWTKKGIVTD